MSEPRQVRGNAHCDAGTFYCDCDDGKSLVRGRLVSVTDSNDNPLVEMAYDVLGNVTRVASTNSVFEYTYDPLNRATNAVCLLTNIPGFATVKYQIAYQFDPVGNVTNRVITGLQGLTESITTRYQYDVMNRLTNVVQLTNAASTASAWYSYDAAGRLWKKGYGNGDVVTHGYDTESRLLSLGITNNTTPVWWWTYGWDNGGNILAITNNGTNVSLYGYDRAGQLTNEVCLTNGVAGGTTNSWQYDEAGNWRSGDGKWRLYNTDNELVGIATSNAPVSIPLTVTGEVEPGPNSNKWYNTWASSRGVSAQVSQTDGTFTLPEVPLYPATNHLAVTVRDVSGNEAQQVRTVSRPFPEMFHYDGNGNLTNWVCGTTNWVYEWDWADRLTKVTSNGVVVLENWYDAGDRRIAKKEVVSGQTRRWLYAFDEWDVLGIVNESGQLCETFTRGTGLDGDIGTVIAVTHEGGSVTPGTYYAHHNHRGDVNVTRSETTTVGSCSYSAFGLLTLQTGIVPCRFMFMSKERETSCGFSYYGFRFYAPQSHRWVNRDLIEEAGGPNLYAFVSNDPVGLLDAFGTDHGGKPPKGGQKNMDCEGFNKNSCPNAVEKAMNAAKAAGKNKSYRALRALLKSIKMGGTRMFFWLNYYLQLLNEACPAGPQEVWAYNGIHDTNMTSDGISTNDWEIVQDYAAKIANAACADNEAASDALTKELCSYLECLECKYGTLPSIIAMRAYYTSDLSQQVQLLETAYQLAKQVKDRENMTFSASSLAQLFTEEARDVSSAQKWLALLADALGDKWDDDEHREFRRLTVQFERLKRKGDRGSLA